MRFLQKIYAFENVRNVHELRRKAHHENIIIPWLEKYIRISHKTKGDWKKLKRNFPFPTSIRKTMAYPRQ